MQSIQFNFESQFSSFDALILPVLADGELPAAVANFVQTVPDAKTLTPFIKSLQEQGDFNGKAGKSLLLVNPSQLDCKRLLLVGLGKQDELTTKTYLNAVKTAADNIANTGASQVVNGLALIAPQQVDNTNYAWSIRHNAQLFQSNLYDYTHKSRGAHEPKQSNLTQVTFPCEAQPQAAKQGQASALGMALTQDLGNMPSNFCTPAYLAETAEELANEYGFSATILEREQMLEMGMGSFMSVAQGSPTPPKMVCISYQGGAKDEAPIALVGKGVTFDTGGISIKPGPSMDEMKYDMGGAATVLGVFKALGELAPKINVVAVIPATENMPSGTAIKPGDVVTSLSGQTIEILNTDAEGRLILCDALTYAQQTFKPAKIIDMATLTGACIIALGHHMSAIMGNDQALIDAILASGETTYDRFWQLPLGEEWDEQLKSNFADMANIGGRAGGSITAGQFLARFTKEVKWAHLDIAGTAWLSGNDKGSTGRPVAALVDYLWQQSQAQAK